MRYNISYKKRDNGKWSYQINIKYNGKWKYHTSKSGFNTKKEAIGYAQHETKEIKEPNKYDELTFKQVSEMYINLKKETPSTAALYRYYLSIFKDIYDVELSQLDFFTLDLLFKDITKEYKYSSLIQFRKFGRIIINFANDKLDLNVKNLFKKIEIKKTIENKPRKANVLTYNEMLDLFDKLGKININYKLLAQFMGLCGLRVSEAKAIRPAILDLKSKEVTINMQQRDDNKLTNKLKSNNSYRTLKLPETIIKTLQEIPRPMGHETPIYTKFIYSSDMTSIYKKCGYNITNHDLRHSFGTMLAQNGVDYKTIAENLGDTLETTISTYSHSNTEMKEFANNIVENL